MSDIPPRTARHGDAMRDIVESHLDGMVSVAHRVLHSEDLAHDAVQDTLLSLWRTGQLRTESRLLCAAVFRASLKILRSRNRRRLHEAAAAARCAHPDRDLRAASTHTGDDARDRLRRAIERLPDGCRETLVLRDVQGVAYSAIARQLGVPMGTVRSRLNRARAILRRELAADPVFPPSHPVSHRAARPEPTRSRQETR